MAKETEKKPSVTCDFSTVSRRWGVRWAQIENDVPILLQVIYADEQDGLSDEEKHAVLVGKIEARQKVNELIDERNALMAQVVTEIPRSWLVPGAPEKIDWFDVNSLLDYIREDKTAELMLGVSVARNEAAKNSLAHTSSNGNTQKPQ